MQGSGSDSWQSPVHNMDDWCLMALLQSEWGVLMRSLVRRTVSVLGAQGRGNAETQLSVFLTWVHIGANGFICKLNPTIDWVSSKLVVFQMPSYYKCLAFGQVAAKLHWSNTDRCKLWYKLQRGYTIYIWPVAFNVTPSCFLCTARRITRGICACFRLNSYGFRSA